jgi:hypothetical protein
MKWRWQCILRSFGNSARKWSQIAFLEGIVWLMAVYSTITTKQIDGLCVVLSLFLAARGLLRSTQLLSWRSASHFCCGVRTWDLWYRSFLHSAKSLTFSVGQLSASANIKDNAACPLLLVIIISLTSHPQSWHMAWHPTILQWCNPGQRSTQNHLKIFCS